MTSRSMMGCSIEPPKSLPPSPMAESDKKEDIAVDRSTFRSRKGRKANQKPRKHKKSRMNKSKQGSKKIMNSDPKSNVHSIYRGNGFFDN